MGATDLGNRIGCSNRGITVRMPPCRRALVGRLAVIVLCVTPVVAGREWRTLARSSAAVAETPFGSMTRLVNGGGAVVATAGEAERGCCVRIPVGRQWACASLTQKSAAGTRDGADDERRPSELAGLWAVDDGGGASALAVQNGGGRGCGVPTPDADAWT